MKAKDIEYLYGIARGRHRIQIPGFTECSCELPNAYNLQ